MRITNYGAVTFEEEVTEEEKAFEYVINTARELDIEVIEGKTAIDMVFIANLIKKLREEKNHEILS